MLSLHWCLCLSCNTDWLPSPVLAFRYAIPLAKHAAGLQAGFSLSQSAVHLLSCVANHCRQVGINATEAQLHKPETHMRVKRCLQQPRLHGVCCAAVLHNLDDCLESVHRHVSVYPSFMSPVAAESSMHAPVASVLMTSVYEYVLFTFCAPPLNVTRPQHC